MSVSIFHIFALAYLNLIKIMNSIFNRLKNAIQSFCVFFFMCVSFTVNGQSNQVLSGNVVDTKGAPLHFASVVLDNGEVYYTDEKGGFSFFIRKDFIPITISYANKRSIRVEDLAHFKGYKGKFTLVDLSITLEEINIVSPTTRAQSGSNTAIVIDKEAIMEAQAFSLKDVLNNLPGHATVRPNIDVAQTINLRGTFDSSVGGTVQQMNNSFGVAIIMDDVNLTNDANMQTRSLSQFGLEGASNSVSQYNIKELTYQGIDLREIPVENIESVEVVQGVASAKYGELTDGAIIINRQAGRTDYQFSTNINRGATSYSLSKGFALPGKWGALNISMNYSKSNSDPRDKVQEYNRINQGVIWTKNFGETVKNTLSFSYSRRLDNVRQDPDDSYLRKLKASDDFFRVSNRTNIKVNTRLIKSLDLNLSGSYGISNTYNQTLINKGPFPIANKDTTGVYEGKYIDGRYIAIEEIEGRPLSLSANINISTDEIGDRFEHKISYGGSINYHDNLGRGTIYNANSPRWFQNGAQNERPYNFRQNEAVANFGAYIMDNFRWYLFNRPVDGNIGVRLDVQNNKVSYQPRLNMAYQITPSSRFSIGYGISTKAPSLAHRYPAPIYLDFPILQFFDDSNINNSLYLVKTQKLETNNNHLKPSKSSQLEVSFSNTGKFLNNSITAHFKDNKDGFGTKRYFVPIEVPEYRVIGELEKGKPIEYEATGNYKTYTNYFIRTMTNSVRSKSYGLDWNLSTQKIQPLNLYLGMSTTLAYSEYYDTNPTVDEVTDEEYRNKYDLYYTIYYPTKMRSLSLMSKFRATYHIPKIGFIVTLSSDVFWFRKGLNKEQTYANEYLDINMQPIVKPIAEDIKRAISSASNDYEQPTFFIINLNAAKEIRKNIRIGINTYNFLNIQINKERKLSDGSVSRIKYSSPFSITGSISIKF